MITVVVVLPGVEIVVSKKNRQDETVTVREQNPEEKRKSGQPGSWTNGRTRGMHPK